MELIRLTFLFVSRPKAVLLWIWNVPDMVYTTSRDHGGSGLLANIKTTGENLLLRAEGLFIR